MKKLIFLILLALYLFPLNSIAQQYVGKLWQEIVSLGYNFKPVVSQEDIEIYASSNTIQIKLNQAQNIQIYTILGKLVSNQKLEPGIFEYKVDKHGVYIIKYETSSCKIAL